MKNKLKVDPIRNGTVIDHIASGKALLVADILKLNPPENLMMVGVNLTSRKMGKKDIIKIENRVLSDDEVNSIALISPTATLIIIEDFTVVKKQSISLPTTIKNHIICPNSNCITNVEKVATRFELANSEPVQVRCGYCEKKYYIGDVNFNFA